MGQHYIPRVALFILCCFVSARPVNSDGSEDEDDQCFRILHPPESYPLSPDEHRTIQILMRINCHQVGRARLVQVFSATGNGTAGSMISQFNIDSGDESLEVSWHLGLEEDTEHWHCSGWRQWMWIVHREGGEQEQQERALMRVRAPLLEEALENVEEEAARKGQRPVFIQIGAMDGVGHDHLHPFIMRGTWEGLLVEPLRDHYTSLVRNYASVSGHLQFANVCIAEHNGPRVMRRLRHEALGREGVVELGLDGSSSLLTDDKGLPPGMAQTLVRKPEAFQKEVMAALVEEEVECVTLSNLLQRRDIAQFDVFAVDTEGYDLRILQQLLPDLHRCDDWVATKPRPKVIFIEVGLLEASDQREAKQLLENSGYTASRCGYGMEMLAVRKDD